MSKIYNNKLVYTLKNRCRVCYTCVRECPVKAIKIVNGQAEVMNELCIGCGHCTNVCSQHAKVFLQTKGPVYDILNEEEIKVAIVAPSFPAEFHEYDDYKVLVGMVKALGFDYVSEVSFGADLVAVKYREHVENKDKLQGGISSDCPAVVYYIKQYHPDLVENLVPVASPMVAMTRVMKAMYGEKTKVVFIGPCVAKKAESKEVDESLTFIELREMFELSEITPQNTTPIEFDPPHGGKGGIFPVSHGLQQTAGLDDDITSGSVVVAEGSKNFIDAIKEYENGEISSNNLELLCCRGCIMGPGMTKGGVRYARRFKVGEYVKERLQHFDTDQWEKDLATFLALDLSQDHKPQDRRMPTPSDIAIKEVLKSMGKLSPEDNLNCGACGYDTCVEHAKAIVNGYAETEMCLPYTINSLHGLVEKLNVSNEKLKTAQNALKQSEKLAHMGQLSAGIAHELNNPLGVIMMYSNIIKDECSQDDPNREDLELIVEQANRCKVIVRGLLNFARKNQMNSSIIDIERFVKRSIVSVIIPKSIKVNFKSIMHDIHAEIDSDQMMQVLTNLEKNAVESMGETGTLSIELEDTVEQVKIKISDTGHGISKENMEKIFTPFFTTKGVGKGTGLGLSLIYGIIKMHKGNINVSSNDDPEKGATGTTFTISVPRKIG